MKRLRVFGGALVAALVAALPTSTVAATAQATQDIRDIRGPIPIPYWWRWWAVAGGAVLLLALGYGIVRWVVHRRRARRKSPAEIALERIELAQSTLSSARPAGLSAELSDAVRVYIEARFGLSAAHRTTEEFIHDLLDEASPVAAHRDELGEFLSSCDLAKFARFALSPGQMQRMCDTARAFVEATDKAVVPAGDSSRPAPQVPLATAEEVGS